MAGKPRWDVPGRFAVIVAAPFCAVLVAPPCAGAKPRPVSVSVSPAYAQLVPGKTLAFSAKVTGAGSKTVIWQVNNATGGAASSGTITASGIYTPPATLPSPAAITITAVSSSDQQASATAAVTLLAQSPAGGTYYVATTGDDSNPGTLAAPFLTVSHAAAVAQAGDTVLVAGGVYHELVAPPHSGNATQGYITLSAMPGQHPVIDGTGLKIPGGQWGLMTLQNSSYVIVQGFELRHYSTDSVKNVPVGVYIFGAGANVQIINNHIRGIVTRAVTTPMQCSSNALGMAVYGSAAPAAIEALAISGNELDHLKTGCSESLSIDGNVDGFAVTGNRVHDNDNIGIDAIGFERVSPDPAYDQARNGEIRGNIVYNITSYGNPDYGRQYASDGIYVDGGTQIVIEQNLVHDVDLGIELASEHKTRVTSYVTARNNVIYNDNSNGISIGGYGAPRGGSDHVIIVNNTLFNNDTKNTGSGEFQIQYHATNNLFANNIVYGSSQGLLVHNYTTNPAPPATLNYNLYYSPLGPSKTLWQWNRTHYTGFAAYLAGSGQDANAPPFSDPMFDDPGTPPLLDIMPGSPAIAAGTDLGASVIGTVDFAGNPRAPAGVVTIGAYQQ